MTFARYRIGGQCRRGHQLTKATLERFWCRNYGGWRHRCGVCHEAKAKAWAASKVGRASHAAAKLRYKVNHGLQIGRRPPSICVESGCNKKVQGFGLCATHYQRWKYATDAEWRERVKTYVRERCGFTKEAPAEFVALFRKFNQLRRELRK